MGVEDDMHVDEADSILTDPEDAKRFCDALDLSAFALRGRHRATGSITAIRWSTSTASRRSTS
jgi:hypothetical protein